jgi:hypothetical protein
MESGAGCIVFTILLGDLSPLKWRGFMQGLASMPYVVNFAISPRIVTALKADQGDNWRWGVSSCRYS